MKNQIISAEEIYAAREQNHNLMNERHDKIVNKQAAKITHKILKKTNRGFCPYLKIRKPRLWVSIMDVLEREGYKVGYDEKYLTITIA